MKKVLSFVLVLSLVLSSFSMAFAGETKTAGLSDIDGVANETAIKVVNDLGIVTGYPDGTYKADRAVTRAEFAVMLTKALNIPASALAGYTSTNFTDVEGYDWAVPYLGFCESKGIMSGYGNGEVKPGNTITVNEAMAMALRAVGYTPNSATLVGTWPSNYVTLAQNVGLYEDIAAVTTVDRGNAAQVIYNVAKVTKVTVNTDGKTEKVYAKDRLGNTVESNLLNTNLGCEGTPGVVAYTTASLIPLADYIGVYADVYTNEDGDIVAIDVIDTTTLKGKIVNGKFVSDDVKYTFDTLDEYLVITNGENVGSTTESGLSTSAITIQAKVTGKTIDDVYARVAWDVTAGRMVTKSVQDEIADGKLLGESFQTDKNGEILANSFALEGVKSLADIEKDDVVYVFVEGNQANATIVRVVVGQEVVTGKVTAYDGDDDVYVVGGKSYGYTNGITSMTLELGAEYELVLDGFGDIYKATKVSGDKNNFAFIYGTAAGNDLNGTEWGLYLPTDETKVVGENEDMTGTLVKENLIAYYLDKNGDIEAFDFAATAAAATYAGVNIVDVAGTTNYAVAADAVVFTVTGTGATLDYDVVKVADLTIGQALETASQNFQYVLNDDNEIVAMVVNTTCCDNNSDDIYAVVDSFSRVYNDSLEKEVLKVVGLADGKTLTIETVNNAVTVTADAFDLYTVVPNADGFAKSFTEVAHNTANGFYVVNTTTYAGLNAAETIILTDGNGAYNLSNEVVVYELVTAADGSISWKVSDIAYIEDDAQVKLFDLSYKAADGVIVDVVLWHE